MDRQRRWLANAQERDVRRFVGCDNERDAEAEPGPSSQASSSEWQEVYELFKKLDSRK